MIIGLSGKAHSGKDTVAQLLAPIHLVRFDSWCDIDQDIGVTRLPAVHKQSVQLALADPIKVFVHQTLGFSRRELWGPSELRAASRKALQTLGTDWGRAHDGAVWVHRCLNAAQELLARPRIAKPSDTEHFSASWLVHVCNTVVISDVRFPDEADAIRAAGGVVWRVERHVDAASDTHVSETALDTFERSYFDATIDNTGTVDQLAAAVSALLC